MLCALRNSSLRAFARFYRYFIQKKSHNSANLKRLHQQKKILQSLTKNYQSISSSDILVNNSRKEKKKPPDTPNGTLISGFGKEKKKKTCFSD